MYGEHSTRHTPERELKFCTLNRSNPWSKLADTPKGQSDSRRDCDVGRLVRWDRDQHGAAERLRIVQRHAKNRRKNRRDGRMLPKGGGGRGGQPAGGRQEGR